MSQSSDRTCPSCGAPLSEEASTCGLCGKPVPSDTPEAPDEPTDEPAPEPVPTEDGEGTSEDEGVYCNACGWENPIDARYCSQCGEQLQDFPEGARPVMADLPRGPSDVDDTSEPEPAAAGSDDSAEQEQKSGIGATAGWIVGGALVAVLALFIVDALSDDMEWGDDDPEPAAQAPGMSDAPMQGGEGSEPAPMNGDMNGEAPAMGDAPDRATGLPGDQDLSTLVSEYGDEDVPAELEERAERLRQEIETVGAGPEQVEQKQEIVELYASAGHIGRAALAQHDMAEMTNMPEHWRRTGDMLYSWMEAFEGEPVSATIANHVVEAYQEVLEQDPDNLDVRTDMATAYLQTNQPMRGVDEINRVLEEDPDHFQARFNRGIMLTMIGRVDEAIGEFERVQEIVGPESPYYDQANQAIETIQAQNE